MAGATNDITDWAVGKKGGLPLPVTASQTGSKTVAQEVLEGTKDVANGGVPESIPMMGQGEKPLEDASLHVPDVTAASSERRGSWPLVKLYFGAFWQWADTRFVSGCPHQLRRSR